MAYRPKHVMEYAALRAAFAVVNALPYRAALGIGCAAAWFGFFALRFRAKEARSRIRCVFGSRYSDAEVTRIAARSLRDIVFGVVETTRISKGNLDWIPPRFDCDRFLAVLKENHAAGRGAIIAAPHMGSWELGAVMMHLEGVPICTLGAAQKNPLVDRYVTHLRSKPGITAVARGPGVMKKMLRLLKDGNVLAILPDVRMKEEGLRVPFLGGEANLGAGMALLARHANVPIFPAVTTRIGWTRHRIEIHEPVFADKTVDKQEDLRRVTVQVMTVLEQAIRRHPEQWFWYNKRWVLQPLHEKKHATDANAEGVDT